MTYLVFKELAIPLMGQKTLTRGVGWDMMVRRGGAVRVMLRFRMLAWPPPVMFFQTVSCSPGWFPTCYVAEHHHITFVSFWGVFCAVSWQAEPWTGEHLWELLSGLPSTTPARDPASLLLWK